MSIAYRRVDRPFRHDFAYPRNEATLRDLIYKPPKTKRYALPALCLGDKVEIRTAYYYSPNSTTYATVIGVNGSIGYIVEFSNGTRRYIASSEGYRVRKV